MVGQSSADGIYIVDSYYYMSGYSNSKKQNVATHELGHALGLDHSTSTDVMDAAITGHTSTQALSQNDKDSYDAAYNNY